MHQDPRPFIISYSEKQMWTGTSVSSSVLSLRYNPHFETPPKNKIRWRTVRDRFLFSSKKIKTEKKRKEVSPTDSILDVLLSPSRRIYCHMKFDTTLGRSDEGQRLPTPCFLFLVCIYRTVH